MGIGTLRRYHGAPKVGQPEAALPEAPGKGDKAETWKAYATARGWDASQSKAKIIEQYEADLALHTDEGSERKTGDGGTETVPAGVVTASEPAPVGEREQRDADAVGEGVTTSADLTGAEDGAGGSESGEGGDTPDESDSTGSGDDSAQGD